MTANPTPANPPAAHANPTAPKPVADRYAQMNHVLDACVADVKKRIASHKTNPPTSDAQIAAMVNDAIAEHSADAKAALLASVIAGVKS